MIGVASPLVQYLPPPSARTSAEDEVGRAFARFWHEGSEASRTQLRDGIGALVRSLRANGTTSESSVLAFKNAIHQYGGVHAFPGLALEHNDDGDECALAYSEAFALFIDVYFGAGPAG